MINQPNAVGKGQQAAPAQWRPVKERMFGIPLQIGPPTQRARSLEKWVNIALLAQTVMCAVRILMWLDFKGGAWMALVCGFGWYGSFQDMNITYMCCWGVLSTVNGVVDALGLLLPLLFSLITFQFTTLLHILCPLAYFAGAAVAWQLYQDYNSQEKESTFSLDPSGQYFDKVPDAYLRAGGPVTRDIKISQQPVPVQQQYQRPEPQQHPFSGCWDCGADRQLQQEEQLEIRPAATTNNQGAGYGSTTVAQQGAAGQMASQAALNSSIGQQHVEAGAQQGQQILRDGQQHIEAGAQQGQQILRDGLQRMGGHTASAMSQAQDARQQMEQHLGTRGAEVRQQMQDVHQQAQQQIAQAKQDASQQAQAASQQAQAASQQAQAYQSTPPNNEESQDLFTKVTGAVQQWNKNLLRANQQQPATASGSAHG